MARKKPKPIGKGNYTVCRPCRGTGWYYHAVAAKISKKPDAKQALAGNICKDCKGIGWVDAER